MKKITAVLNKARMHSIERAARATRDNDFAAKADWERKRAFLDGLLHRFQGDDLESLPPKCVFVSYSKDSGEVQFQMLRERLKEEGFDVVTGFDKTRDDDGIVLRRVMNQLRLSTVYLGLLTKTVEVLLRNGSKVWAPSVWTLEEKGLAVAMEKPIVLFVESGIHEDYWLKTAPHKVHQVFENKTFAENVEEAVAEVTEKYVAVANRSLGAGGLTIQ